jgi:hypothetical protein
MNSDEIQDKVRDQGGRIQMPVPRRRVEHDFAVDELDFFLGRRLLVKTIPTRALLLDLSRKQRHRLDQLGRVTQRLDEHFEGGHGGI